MSKQLFNGCLSVGLHIGLEGLKHVLAPKSYHVHNKFLANPAYEVNAVSITRTDLFSDVASDALLAMRAEVKKAFKSYGKKVGEIEEAANILVAQVNSKLVSAHQKVDESLNKFDLLADMLLYKMVESHHGTLSYNANFYNEVKQEVGRCGVDLLKDKESPAAIDAANEKKYGTEVDKRLEKLGYDAKDQSELRDKLIEEAASNNYKGAHDSVKFPLISGFFKVLGNFVEEIFETTAEIAFALITGHVIDFDEMDAIESNPLANDNRVGSKGVHKASAEKDLIAEAEAKREIASEVKEALNPFANFDFSSLEGTVPDMPSLGEIAPSLVEDSLA